MKKLLILVALTAVAGASVGCSCCGLGRRVDYCPPVDQCDECNQCQPGGFGPGFGAPVGGPVYSTPAPAIMPGPAATTTHYLPR
jgi:hypothetical protein